MSYLLCLCRFLSRPDVKALKMAEFLDHALMVVNTSDSACVQSHDWHPFFIPVFSFSHSRGQYAGDDPAIWSPLHSGKLESMLSILPPLLPSTSSFPPSQASLFKHAKRADMVQFAPTVLQHLSSCGLAESDNTLLRKLNVKLAQVTLTV